MFFGCSSFSNGTLSFFPQILLLSLISTGFHQVSDGDDDDDNDDDGVGGIHPKYLRNEYL